MSLVTTLHGAPPGLNPAPRHERKGDWILTFSGLAYWPLDPRPEEVRLVDIAHGLALENRYGGHTYEPYSVAQHSVLVARRVMGLWSGNTLLGQEALLHDATEAYLKDIPRPVKKHLPKVYQEWEDDNARAISDHFRMGGDWLVHLDPRVKAADIEAMWTEKRDLRPPEPYTDHAAPEWCQPWAERIEPWSWRRAEAEFLSLAAQLGLR